MTKSDRSPRAARALALLALLAAAPLAGCSSDEPPARQKPAPTAPAENKASAPTPEAPKAPALAVSPTEWPGVEARLTNLRSNGNMLLVEVTLVNTGAAPATIEHYSATEATMTDDASKMPYEVFALPGGQPVATTDLTQTLQPGESTAVNATFPLPSTAKLVTVTFPRMGLFQAVRLVQPQPDAEPKHRDKGEKAEKRGNK
jgi:hypothetical protein